MAAVAVLAGADPGTTAHLGVAMLALQASIGALNDVIDAPHDAGRKPGKPIPAGLVSRRTALAVVVGAAFLGIALAWPSGPMTVALALAVLGVGYAYDLAFKGTAWSWLPFAFGIPLLPVFGWLGTAGQLPASFAVLLPAAVLAGAGLAVANARADAERDAAAGVASVALRLGTRGSWAVNAALLVVVVASALGTVLRGGSVAPLVGAGLLGAAAVTGIGVGLGFGGDSARRERAWELQAIGVSLLAAAWLAAAPVGG
ncbi:MAG: UbiA family prenyltransferase [Chloroflexota bacterium]